MRKTSFDLQRIAIHKTEVTDVLVDGPVAYHLRFYTDGTFDVFAPVDGSFIAIAGIGTDGAITGSSLASRRDAVARWRNVTGVGMPNE